MAGELRRRAPGAGAAAARCVVRARGRPWRVNARGRVLRRHRDAGLDPAALARLHLHAVAGPRVSDRAALTAAGIREPFGYLIGVVPPRARQVSAMALDASGEVLGSLSFDRLALDMHPTVFIGLEE